MPHPLPMFNLILGFVMTLTPLLTAPLAIQIHVATVVPAAFLGAFLLAHRKGTRWHRRLGRLWIGLMVVSALSSFFIGSINLFFGFSPIHVLSILVLWSSLQAVRAARRGDIAAHRKNILGMYVGGIIVAGGFTLVPGRLMNNVVFSGFPADFMLDLGAVLVLASVLVAPVLMVLRDRTAWRRPR